MATVIFNGKRLQVSSSITDYELIEKYKDSLNSQFSSSRITVNGRTVNVSGSSDEIKAIVDELNGKPVNASGSRIIVNGKPVNASGSKIIVNGKPVNG